MGLGVRVGLAWRGGVLPNHRVMPRVRDQRDCSGISAPTEQYPQRRWLGVRERVRVKVLVSVRVSVTVRSSFSVRVR